MSWLPTQPTLQQFFSYALSMSFYQNIKLYFKKKNVHLAFTSFVAILPGLQDERDQTAWEPISLTVPVLSNCFGSAPGGVLFGVVISSKRKQMS